LSAALSAEICNRLAAAAPCNMIFFAICLYRSLVSLFFALAARPMYRLRRLLTAAMRPLFCCFASCRITTSRSASAIFHFLKCHQNIPMLNYAIADAALQLCGWRTRHLGISRLQQTRQARRGLAMQARINPQEIATLLRHRAGGLVIRRCRGAR